MTSKERIEKQIQRNKEYWIPRAEQNILNSEQNAAEMQGRIERGELVEPKQSKWVWKRDLVGGQNRLLCRECDKECFSKDNYYVETNYCPNCGAKMEG